MSKVATKNVEGLLKFCHFFQEGFCNNLAVAFGNDRGTVAHDFLQSPEADTGRSHVNTEGMTEQVRVDSAFYACAFTGPMEDFTKILRSVERGVSKIGDSTAVYWDDPLFVAFAGNDDDTTGPIYGRRDQVAGFL